MGVRGFYWKPGNLRVIFSFKFERYDSDLTLIFPRYGPSTEDYSFLWSDNALLIMATRWTSKFNKIGFQMNVLNWTCTRRYLFLPWIYKYGERYLKIWLWLISFYLRDKNTNHVVVQNDIIWICTVQRVGWDIYQKHCGWIKC